jgi:CRISPR-associated protein Csb3
MKTVQPTIRVNVDPTNPGQFFACCGMLELADRLWPGTEGWFVEREFYIECPGTLAVLLQAVINAELTLEGPEDADGKKNIYSGPGRLGAPFNLTLDWWLDHAYHEADQNRGSRVKPWAGTMESVGIARAMKQALDRPGIDTDPFKVALVVPSADDPKKKKEPFHFDSRRGANALPLDVGFVQDALGIQTLAHPAVEFFALVGLQRCRPRPTTMPRVFDYFTWSIPCGPAVLPAAVCGLLSDPQSRGYRFENAFRTGQKKHKAFNPATPRGDSR